MREWGAAAREREARAARARGYGGARARQEAGHVVSGARQWWRRAPAWLPCTGHVSPLEAFYRARGGRRYGRRGESIWAASMLNLAMGPKQSLLTLVSSTFLIKGAKSFELWISR